jgi:single-strand DNA-binding protein
MASRSLNKAVLIGNLTRDPELRYTPQGTPVCTIGLATNRSWTDSSGQRQEETEFHRLVAWNKLAELCDQLLFKGRKVYIEGRLQTRRWTTQDGQERQTTEIVIDDMIVLDNKHREGEGYNASANTGGRRPAPAQKNTSDKPADPAPVVDAPVEEKVEEKKEDKLAKKADKKADLPAGEKKEEKAGEELNADDIPF